MGCFSWLSQLVTVVLGWYTLTLKALQGAKLYRKRRVSLRPHQSWIFSCSASINTVQAKVLSSKWSTGLGGCLSTLVSVTAQKGEGNESCSPLEVSPSKMVDLAYRNDLHISTAQELNFTINMKNFTEAICEVSTKSGISR